MVCSKCNREIGHLRDCEEIADLIPDAISLAGILKFPQTDFAIANVASLIKKDGYPDWYRPLAERKFKPIPELLLQCPIVCP